MKYEYERYFDSCLGHLRICFIVGYRKSVRREQIAFKTLSFKNLFFSGWECLCGFNFTAAIAKVRLLGRILFKYPMIQA